MFQAKQIHKTYLSNLKSLLMVFCLIGFPGIVCAQLYEDPVEMKNKLKVELQYADYGEYEYPEPIVFQYGSTPYQQNQPYIANFPEKRVLLKITRLVGSEAALGLKYQFSDMREDAKQHFTELRLTRSLNESVVGLVTGQFIYDSRKYGAYQWGIGALWDINAANSLQGDVQYYYRGKNAEPVGGKLGVLNLRLKYRRVLTLSTALITEYSHYNAKGDATTFNSHGVTVWLSQYLPTNTAIHLNMRYYTNSLGISSLAPGIEIAQYLDWATVLGLKYRYYRNKSNNVSFGEQAIIIPDGLRSNSFSIQLSREMTPEFLLYGRYRYYSSNLSVKMNTYMLGGVYSF